MNKNKLFKRGQKTIEINIRKNWQMEMIDNIIYFYKGKGYEENQITEKMISEMIGFMFGVFDTEDEEEMEEAYQEVKGSIR